jgi:acyl-CoA synthetase (AMP-forming)/AMP-acid ligase II
MLALPNTPATVVAGLAVNMLGGISVEVNRQWSAEALGDILRRSHAQQAFVWARDAEALGPLLARSLVEHVWGVDRDGLPRAFHDQMRGLSSSLLLEDGRVDPDLGAAAPGRAAQLSPDWPALVLYTSGSTGKPHGVIQTFRNVDANTRSIVEYLRLTAEDRALLTLPLFYCYGRSVLQTHLFTGGSVFLDDRMAFPRTIMQDLSSEECTGFAGVPLTYELIRRQVDLRAIRFPRLRYVTQAGGAMAPDTIAWARAAFHPASLFVMYGQTEATARLSYLPPDQAAAKPGSIGIAIPGVELRVVDQHGSELPPGEVGELVARGQNVTPGYLDEPAETRAILHDGWLWTGDLAYRDSDGFFFHYGRAKEILKIGGHRVSPVEIERVIALHPGVAEAGVLGIRDALLGEAAKAIVVPKSGARPSAADLARFCRERLPANQVPVSFVLVKTLPRNEAGKLLRADLVSRYGGR